MRFEKITDNKIKIFFSFDDMNKNHISRKILFSNNAFSQNFIQSVLKSAEQNLNFKIENENILIEILLKILEIIFFINLISLKIF